MFSSFFRKRVYPIGVDIGSCALKMAQLACDGKGICVTAGASEKMPAGLEAGGSEWQRWTARTLKRLTSNGTFRGRDVITALPADDVFIDQITVPKLADERLREAVLGKVRSKLPFDSTDMLLKYVVTSEQSGGSGSELEVLVMAAERLKVERHLAIYESANLQIKAIGVWPLAMTNSYSKFFGRRASDTEMIVMLLETGAKSTKVVICRGRNLLFARLIPLGVRQLMGQEMIKRLILELAACDRFFESISGAGRIERLVYLSGQATERGVCDHLSQLAQRWHIPAQIGDVLGAVEVRTHYGCGFDRRGCRVNWATAFGLSLL